MCAPELTSATSVLSTCCLTNRTKVHTHNSFPFFLLLVLREDGATVNEQSRGVEYALKQLVSNLCMSIEELFLSFQPDIYI